MCSLTYGCLSLGEGREKEKERKREKGESDLGSPIVKRGEGSLLHAVVLLSTSCDMAQPRSRKGKGGGKKPTKTTGKEKRGKKETLSLRPFQNFVFSWMEWGGKRRGEGWRRPWSLKSESRFPGKKDLFIMTHGKKREGGKEEMNASLEVNFLLLYLFIRRQRLQRRGKKKKGKKRRVKRPSNWIP